MWKKEKLLVLSNFFFYHYVFKKLSAAEASESIYMRERVDTYKKLACIPKCEQISVSKSRILKKLKTLRQKEKFLIKSVTDKQTDAGQKKSNP